MRNLKERAYAGEKLYGTMVCLFDAPDIARILQVCGFDFFVIDGEHGYFDDAKMAGMLINAKVAGIPAIVRVACPQREFVLKYMDMGAAGLLLPNTETAEQAKALVEYSKYAPLGNRGVSLTRAHTLYEPVKAVDYMKRANEETILMVQIESPIGVKNINDILSIEGIDCAFVGPNDLSQSLGIMGQMDNPILVEAIDRVIVSAKDHGKFSGIHMSDIARIKGWIDKGMTFNLWSADTLMIMSAARMGLKELKG